jgi:CPA2 family monovalent cation:H+ antiporter-2
MSADPAVLRDLALVCAAALLGGALARLARQPLVLGYILGGILLGTVTSGPAVSHRATFETFAEVGVILLMFSVGIEFSLKDLERVRTVALVGGPAGIALHVALAVGVGAGLGWPLRQSLAVGLVVSVSSTMVLLRLLMDRGELHTRHGRIMVGTSLVEDLAVVVFMVLLSELDSLADGRLSALATVVARALLLLGSFWLLAVRAVPHLMSWVARTRSTELFLLVALAVAVGTAAVTQALGLSLALGAFLAGLAISESEYAHETLARLLPLRDTFVAFFFVTVGGLVDLATFTGQWPLLGVLGALVVGGRLAIRTAVTRAFGYPLATALLVGAGLAQMGEFSFVLVQVARRAGHVGEELHAAVLAASLLTLLLNAALMRVADGVVGRGLKAPAPEEVRGSVGDHESVGDHVVVCGFGRVGSAVGEALETFRLPYVVVEIDPEIVRALRSRGVRCLYGDAAHGRVLEAAGVDRARLVVIALPDHARAGDAVRQARALNPRVPVLARAHVPEVAERLRADGATDVIQPELEAGLTLIRHALAELALPREHLVSYVEALRDALGGARRRGATAGRGLPEVRELVVEPGALADQSLADARVRERFGVSVLRVERSTGEVEACPDARTILRVGDRIRVFGLPHQIAALETALRRPE